MNLNDLTIGQAKELAALFNGVHPYQEGQDFFTALTAEEALEIFHPSDNLRN